MIYNFYIYDRMGKCLYYEEWNKTSSSSTCSLEEMEEKKRLMFGLIFSLKEFITKVSPKEPEMGLMYYKTKNYICHHLEVLSGIRFILTTDDNVNEKDIQQALHYIYTTIYVEYIVKNPLSKIGNGDVIQCHLFEIHLKQYITSLTCF